MQLSAARQLGVVRDYNGLIEICRSRAEELQLTREAIDQLAGFTSGHASKLLTPQPMKVMANETLASLIPALGLELIVVEDPQSVEEIKKRGFKRNALRAKHAGTVHIRLSERHMRKIRRLGGQNSRKHMTKAKARQLARKAAAARWSAAKAMAKLKGNAGL
jgi:hypothetical protein